jgi:hypothetical protein
MSFTAIRASAPLTDKPPRMPGPMKIGVFSGTKGFTVTENVPDFVLSATLVAVTVT